MNESILKLPKFLVPNFIKKANSFTWIWQRFCINFKNTFFGPALNDCFLLSETNKSTGVTEPLTYSQFSKFLNFIYCLMNIRIWTELYEVFRCKCSYYIIMKKVIIGDILLWWIGSLVIGISSVKNSKYWRQKHPPEVFYKKVFIKLRKIHKKTTVPESLF